MRYLFNRCRYRGAHRSVAPGPMPARPAVDPWAGHPLFDYDPAVASCWA